MLSAKGLPLSLPDEIENSLGDSYLLPYFGRDALRLAALTLQLQPQDTVLLPAYLDDAVVRAFLAEGLKVDFYAVTDGLHADLGDLESALGHQEVKAVLAIHYEGIPQPMKELVDMCRREDIPVIEDCAHLFPIRPKLAISGDIAIFSLRKFLPVPDGAILVANDETLLRRAEQLISKLPDHVIIASLKSTLICTNLLLRKQLCKSPNVPIRMLTAASAKACMRFAPESLIPRMTWLSRGILQELNLCVNGEVRVRNYQFYRERCPFPPLFDELPPQCVPLTYAIRVDESVRNCLLHYLHQNNVIAAVHYDLPTIISPCKHPLSYHISRSVVNLPLHQDVTRAQLQYIVGLLHYFSKKWL
jgi:dTDP-4-amino-4,6-dideoxygalactose transaminase